MSFIDRLLQNRRIITKVLLFVIPLVLLIAGVGLAGYSTANTLNGHMSVTRATIEIIGDFENLQARLQDFTVEPGTGTFTALRASIERQAVGAAGLERLLSGEDRARMSGVAGLAADMAAKTDTLWSIRESQLNNSAEIKRALDAIAGQAAGVNGQVGSLKKAYESKERFAKSALFDAYAFKTIALRVQNLRDAIQAASDDGSVSNAASIFVSVLKQELEKFSASITNKNSLAKMKPVQIAADDMLAAIAGPTAMADKARTLRAAADGFATFQNGLATDAMTKASDAASVFVDLEGEINALKSVLEQIDSAFEAIDALRLHMERFLAQPSEETRKAVMAAVDSLSASSAKAAALNPATRDFAVHLEPLLRNLTEASVTAVAVAQTWKAGRLGAMESLAAGMAGLKDFVARAQEIGKDDSDRSAQLALVAMVAGTLLAVAGGAMLIETLRGPLRRVTEVMTRLAAGDLAVKIEGRDRRDEIGDMVRSVTVFRDAAVENIRLAQDRANIAHAQRQALSALSDVLGKLAEGDLARGMDAALAADFIDMAQTYNRAVGALRVTLADVRATADDIDSCTGNLAASSDDLASRTEQQAAALEQSAQALHHLGEIVRATAESAQQTSVSVNETEAFAVQSGAVVARAVSAMGEISRSSEKIATIIGVIDEIAFQTNLLALNADVEAARVGAAGRGFAVIAQEVRKLAQRCADAAREIKGLITASSTQVVNGVHLVEQTGEALTEIIAHITGVRELVVQISAATGEQTICIGEMTKAVQDVELITERNAAMVEENNAEIHGLQKRVALLSGKIERFKTGDAAAV